MSEIIEDTISRNKEFQEGRRKKVQQLKNLGAPRILIEHEEMLSKMTLAEYKVYLDDMKKEELEIKAEYAKNNPIQKHIVDEIYSRAEKLDYSYWVHFDDNYFLQAIDPLKFMSEDDFNNDLYQTFLDHAKEVHNKKYSDEFKKDHEQYLQNSPSEN
jgi:hypothetical protein